MNIKFDDLSDEQIDKIYIEAVRISEKETKDMASR